MTTDFATDNGIFNDISLHVEDTGGTGRPIVLIHGWPLSGESFRPQIPALQAAGYRVITYDRRGFGRSDKTLSNYTYDALTGDLNAILDGLDLTDVTLVGFSMGGGEVARYVAHYGTDRIRSIVLASAVTPCLMQTPTNPEGPLTPDKAAKMTASLTASKDSFLDQFMTDFYIAGDHVAVSEDQRQDSLAIAEQCDKSAALACMSAFASTDFRDDIATITIPTLIIHGDSDAVVPYDGSGKRTHNAIAGSQTHVIAGGPHGCNVSHTAEWNDTVLAFLAD